MYPPRSGFRSGGTCERTLVPAFVLGNIRIYPRSGFRSTLENHPFVNPPDIWARMEGLQRLATQCLPLVRWRWQVWCLAFITCSLVLKSAWDFWASGESHQPLTTVFLKSVAIQLHLYCNASANLGGRFGHCLLLSARGGGRGSPRPREGGGRFLIENPTGGGSPGREGPRGWEGVCSELGAFGGGG